MNIQGKTPQFECRTKAHLTG